MAQESYNPLTDSLYMSPQMKQFFKQKLEEERERLNQTVSFYALSPDFDTCHSQADPLDQSTIEHLSQTHHAFYTHENFLYRQIEGALQRLASGKLWLLHYFWESYRNGATNGRPLYSVLS